MSINLITSFYIPNNEPRSNELKITLNKNVLCKHIESIHLFVDNDECRNYIEATYLDYLNKKVIIISEYKQPKYSDLFHYANTNLRDKLCFIANSDIWIKTVSIDLNTIIYEDVALALTRHESDGTTTPIDCYQGSHDAFVFKSPLKNNSMIKHLQFVQNILGAENVVLYELMKYGYKLLNPCHQIVIVHEHASNVRTYNVEHRINRGDYDGDGVFKVRSRTVAPCIINMNSKIK